MTFKNAPSTPCGFCPQTWSNRPIPAIQACRWAAPRLRTPLWTRHLRHSPQNPSWPERDRFILSGGHGCALLYSLLHLTGYDLPLDELKHFRQWGSRTPGHPEYGLTPGVETTTGPLGQGFSNGVGMAIAESSPGSRVQCRRAYRGEPLCLRYCDRR